MNVQTSRCGNFKLRESAWRFAARYGGDEFVTVLPAQAPMARHRSRKIFDAGLNP